MSSSFRFPLDPFCLFCRGLLHLPQCTSKSCPVDDWEADVLLFHNRAADAAHGLRISALRANLKSMSISQSGNTITVLSVDPVRNVRHFARKPVYFSHVSCWQVARQQVAHLSHTQVFRLGQQTERILPFECWKTKETFESVFSIPEGYRTSGGFDSTQLLSQCSRLPVELHENILQYLPYCMEQALINASHTAASLARLTEPRRGSVGMWMEPLRMSSEDLRGRKTLLHASLVSLFGHIYLHSLEVVDEEDQGEQDVADAAIPIEDGNVIGIKFVLKLHGLSAIRLIYQDGSLSPWLGDCEDGWHATEYGPGLDSLWVTRDDLKLTKVSFAGPDGDVPPSWWCRAIWDVEPEFRPRDCVRVVDTIRRLGTLPQYPGFRLCHYLPLEIHGTYATGLQVYVQYGGISGLAVLHGKSGQEYSVGWRTGDTYYVQFQRDERIIFMAILTSDPNENMQTGPGLLIQTNYDRSAFFGATLMVRRRLMPSASFSFITPDKSGYVTGLVVDALSRRSVHLRGIGAAIRPARELIRPDGSPSPAPFWNAPDRRAMTLLIDEYETGGHTVAYFHRAVRRLQVQKTLGYCTGMLVHDIDGRVQALGQWETSNRDIHELYSSANGPLDALSFHYEANPSDGHRSRIVNITVGRPAEDNDSRIITCDFSESWGLCWLFCSSYNWVLPWHGVDMMVTEMPEAWETNEILTADQDRQLAKALA